MAGGNDQPTDEKAAHTDEHHPQLSRRRLIQLGVAGVAGSTAMVAGGRAAESTDLLEIVADRDASVEYTFTSDESIEPVYSKSFSTANSAEDSVAEDAEGTWTATGKTTDGYADAFELSGPVRTFEANVGTYRLYLNGDRITLDELVEPKEEREHSYLFEGAGDSWSDYYLETEDGGDLLASTLDGAVIEPDFHWISQDGTKAAGRVDPGEKHAYEFDNLLLDVTIDGEATGYVDGKKSDLDWYPRPGATGDSWKGGFPWQQTEEEKGEREHSYSFEGTGDSWADYYLEVEDNADMYASTLDGAVIEADFHWVSEDGTKAAGRVDPGERHAYEFNNLVLDVTIEGEADAFVDGQPSDLDYYPRPGATGDDWKGGFPWQEEETSTSDGPVMGGGAGYPNTITRSEADFVVNTRSELDSALSSASAGDVVFVPGGEQINLGNGRYDIPDGVTLASSRGVNGSAGGLLYTGYEPWKLLTIEGSGRLTGVRLKGAHPGDDTGGDSSSVGVQVFGAGEVDNCEIWGFTYAAVRAVSGDGMHVHHNVIRENNRSGYGYGVAAESGTPIIEYNYFNYNRHGVKTAGQNPGYTCRYNHFGPQLTDHRIDMHDPAGVHYDVHNNIVEGYIATKDRFEGTKRPAVTVRGVPDDVAAMNDNWFFNPEEPLASPSGWTDEAITQALVDEWRNVTYSGNYYGENANVTYSDIIPGYDGWRTA